MDLVLPEKISFLPDSSYMGRVGTLRLIGIIESPESYIKALEKCIRDLPRVGDPNKFPEVFRQLGLYQQVNYKELAIFPSLFPIDLSHPIPPTMKGTALELLEATFDYPANPYLITWVTGLVDRATNAPGFLTRFTANVTLQPETSKQEIEYY